MIITKTPFRLSFFGGGTDYNEWYEKHGGLVVGCAFKKYCYISVRQLPPFFEHKTRLVYSKMEIVKKNHEIQHNSVRGCLSFLKFNDGLEIHHDGDLPARSGIGSSSSFTVGFLHALHAYKSEMLSKIDLAREAIHVEQKVLKENVGVQDQLLSALGGLQIIELGKNGTITTNPLILPKDYLNEFQNHFLIGFTGLTRDSTDVAEEHVKGITSGKNESALSEIHAITQSALDLFYKKASFEEFGNLFNATWKIKRFLSEKVSNTVIDSAYEIAKKTGAWGGKVMGAGGGGFMMFFAPPEYHHAIKNELRNLIKVWIPFEIDHSGTQVLMLSDD